jgi:hypothetical protein
MALYPRRFITIAVRTSNPTEYGWPVLRNHFGILGCQNPQQTSSQNMMSPHYPEIQTRYHEKKRKKNKLCHYNVKFFVMKINKHSHLTSSILRNF